MSNATPAFRWHFFRSGGFDQVAIEHGEDLRHLHELDPKLWSALNCPVSGLEFDPRTAALIDTDGDGQIRVPEILAAVNWACHMLQDANVLFASPGVQTSAVNQEHGEGRAVAAALRGVLRRLGKQDNSVLTVEDLADPARLFPPD